MAETYKIEVDKRVIKKAKSFLRESRIKNRVPGVFYSYDSKSSIPFWVDRKILTEAMKSEAQIFKVAVGNKNLDVIFKAVQYHPLTDAVLHVDLYGVRMDKVVTIKIPLLLEGQPEGVKVQGGILSQALNEIEIICFPGDIPPNISIDVSELEIGDSIKLADLKIDDKISLTGIPDLVIASVTLAAKEEESVEEIDEDEEFIEGEEGEEGAQVSPEDKKEGAEPDKKEGDKS